MRRFLVLTILIVIASISLIPAASAEHHVEVPFYPMHSPTCAARSLQTALSFYGYNYSISLPLQLMD